MIYEMMKFTSWVPFEGWWLVFWLKLNTTGTVELRRSINIVRVGWLMILG